MSISPRYRKAWRQYPASYVVAAILGSLCTACLGVVYIKLLGYLSTHPTSPRGRSDLLDAIMFYSILSVGGAMLLACLYSVAGGLSAGIFTKWWMDDEKINKSYRFLRSEDDALFYSRIDQVRMMRTLPGKFFGYGTIILTAPGKEVDFIIPNVSRPIELYKYFSQMARHNQAWYYDRQE